MSKYADANDSVVYTWVDLQIIATVCIGGQVNAKR